MSTKEKEIVRTITEAVSALPEGKQEYTVTAPAGDCGADEPRNSRSHQKIFSGTFVSGYQL